MGVNVDHWLQHPKVNYGQMFKRTGNLTRFLQNKLIETLIAPKNMYTIIKWSQTLIPSLRCLGTRGVWRSAIVLVVGYVPLRMHISQSVSGDLGFVKARECSGHSNSGKDLLRQRIDKQVVYSIHTVRLERSYCFCNQLGFGICRVYGQGVKVRN